MKRGCCQHDNLLKKPCHHKFNDLYNHHSETSFIELVDLYNQHVLHDYLCMQQTLEALLESGYDLIKEQKLIMETKLSKEYMKNMDDEQV